MLPRCNLEMQTSLKGYDQKSKGAQGNGEPTSVDTKVLSLGQKLLVGIHELTLLFLSD